MHELFIEVLKISSKRNEEKLSETCYLLPLTFFRFSMKRKTKIISGLAKCTNAPEALKPCVWPKEQDLIKG